MTVLRCRPPALVEPRSVPREEHRAASAGHGGVAVRPFAITPASLLPLHDVCQRLSCRSFDTEGRGLGARRHAHKATGCDGDPARTPRTRLVLQRRHRWLSGDPFAPAFNQSDTCRAISALLCPAIRARTTCRCSALPCRATNSGASRTLCGRGPGIPELIPPAPDTFMKNSDRICEPV